jgi:hypothetical protein
VHIVQTSSRQSTAQDPTDRGSDTQRISIRKLITISLSFVSSLHVTTSVGFTFMFT